MPDPSDPGRLPGRRRAEEQPSGTHPRTASRRARRRPLRWLPTPAVAGATALVVAGIGAVVVSSGAAGTAPAAAHDSMRSLSASLDASAALPGPSGGVAPEGTPDGTPNGTRVGSDDSRGAATTYTQGGDVGWPSGTGNAGIDHAVQQVSRGVDRATLQQQTELQAQQRMQALAELASKVQQRADELASNQWVLPLTGYQLSAGFGETSYLWATVHTGLDMSAPEGTPLVAVARGTVTSVKYDGAYGNKTEITLEDGTEIWYCHQSSQQVAVGDLVAPGQRIGAVGSTGNTTGPHLHIEVHPDGGDAVDPYTAMVGHGITP